VHGVAVDGEVEVAYGTAVEMADDRLESEDLVEDVEALRLLSREVALPQV
jgi:hypothetical protein